MNIPRSEYPRPQFFRDSWQCLNGEWDFAFDFGKSGKDRGYFKPETKFDKKILVPFCPESKLSGIECKDFLNSVWYKRTITLTEEQLKNRVLLHFGAVDYYCTVAINGEICGSHKGGYSSFCFEITKYLHVGENTITVNAVDEQRNGKQPRGKQCGGYYSAGCDYTRTTGIWQTVWLEFVPEIYLKSVKIITDYKNNSVSFTAKVDGESSNMSLLTRIFFEGELQAEKEVSLNCGSTPYSMTVDNVRLWEPGNPNLYDVEYILYVDGKMMDKVQSYFGFRTVTLENHAIYINGKPVYQRLVLDQGFYPDGIYTAPSDADLKRDIELSMALGFNGARLHEKMFEERYLYWADRLGYIVWGEHANWGLDITTYESLANFLPEWMETLERDFNHPSIVGWCPFNETWDYNHRRQDDRVLYTVYQVTKAIDSTRPVIDTSGNFHVITDIYDIHDYEQDTEIFTKRYAAVTKDEVYETFPDRQRYGGQPYFVSEYGGMFWAPYEKDGWGYGKAPEDEKEFANRYASLTKALMDNENICAFCYTQLYDVEQEKNGLYTYDRKQKFSPETYELIRSVNQAVAGTEKKK